METLANSTISLRKYDPTHTTFLRDAWAKDMKRRFKTLKQVIYTGIVKEDCFGLKQPLNTNQLVSPGNRAFSFLRNPEKVEAFMRWIREQQSKGIISTGQASQLGQAVNTAWTDMYVLDSYKRGVLRARAELNKAGFQVPSTDGTGGIDLIMAMPMHMDRVGLLYTRVFTELQGITASMDTMISRILSQGIMDGDGPALLARKLIAALDGNNTGKLGMTDSLGRYIPAERRAIILARTEVIRAFHLGAIQEYRNWGLEGVYVLAEWSTAGDDRVCSKCAPMDGKIFTLDEIEYLIPFHPQCRCMALPYLKELQKYIK